jgi:hypothetical protein
VLLEAQHQYNDATRKPFHQAREREYREGGSYRGGDVIIFELPKTTTGEALIIIIIIIIIIILLLLLPPPSSLLPLGVCLLVGGCYFPRPSMISSKRVPMSTATQARLTINDFSLLYIGHLD